MIEGLKIYGSDELFKKIENQPNCAFICTIGTTETSKIEGISGAGASAEQTKYTPAADVELMTIGEVKCTNEMAQTVIDGDSAPTPAIISKAALNLSKIPFMIVNAGCEVDPVIQITQIGTEGGKDIRTGHAVENAEEIYYNAVELGMDFAELHDYIVVGESMPAGTTTALGVLKALGYDANFKVSGSAPTNPHELKINTVNEGLKNAGINPENDDPETDIISPFDAVKAVGDPIIPALAGIAMGSNKPVILAGGTQMCAVCALIKTIDPEFDFSRIALATTVYVAEDETADLFNIIKQIDENIPVYVIDPGFEKTEHKGLQNYLKGFVKEGAGAGGAMLLALIKGNDIEQLREAIVKECEK